LVFHRPFPVVSSTVSWRFVCRFLAFHPPFLVQLEVAFVIGVLLVELGNERAGGIGWDDGDRAYSRWGGVRDVCSADGKVGSVSDREYEMTKETISI
jgi:hypothetical protein